MVKVLVAGGSGFIGSHLCEKLLTEGYEVLCVDNLLTGSQKNIEHLLSNPRFTFINHDITKPFKDQLEVDAIFHLASPASPNHHSKISYHALPMETMMANTVGTKLLLELAKKNNAKFLYASTSEAYGDPLQHPQTEEYRGNVSSIGPRSVYDEAKRFGETLTMYYFRNENVDTRIVRIFNTYGPRMHKNDMRMIIRFITQALSSEPITVFGDGKQTRCLCYVDDLVEGLMRLMFYPHTAGVVVNIGSQQEHTVLDYAKMVKHLTSSKSEIIHSEALPTDDPKKRQPDISLAKTLLQWEPTITLEKGLLKMIEYIRTTL